VRVTVPNLKERDPDFQFWVCRFQSHPKRKTKLHHRLLSENSGDALKVAGFKAVSKTCPQSIFLLLVVYVVFDFLSSVDHNPNYRCE
jgi:hypothetical protein